MTRYRSWPAPVRTLAVAIDAAVTAATAGAVAEFDEARAALQRVDTGLLGVVLGEVTRTLLERSHPDGLDSDDAQAMIDRCAQAGTWFVTFDRDAMILVLTGALGVLDPDESPAAAAPLAAHGLLLIADLLAVLDLELEPVLDEALRELRRAQTVELP